MLKFVHRAIVYSIFILPFILGAQIDRSKIPSIRKEEKRIIKDIQLLVNTQGKEEEGYKKAHHQIKTRALKSNQFKADLNLVLSSYFKNKAMIDSSLYYTKRILTIKHFKNDTIKNEIYGLTYNMLGILNSKIGLEEKSKKWHLKGINISQKYNDRRIYYINSFGLANAYLSTKEYENSLRLYKQCLEYTEHSEIVYGSYVNMANIYGYLENYETTILYLKKAREMCKKFQRNHCIGIISNNIGITYRKQGNMDQALIMFDEALEIAATYQYPEIEIIGYLEKGLILNHQKKHKEAEKIILLALKKSKELGFLNKQKSIYYRLKEVSISQNDYKKALSYAEKFYEVSDSIRFLENDKEINELEVRYQTLQKEKEIKVLQVQNTNRELDLKNQEEAIKNLRLQQEIEKKETHNKILSFQNASEKKLNEITLLKKDQEIQESKLARQKSIKNSILYSFLILLIPVIGLLFTYYQKLQTQNELNKKQEEISEQKISSLIKDQELKLIKASIKGQDKERKRIALELHDSIGGNLAAIKLQLNNTVLNGNKKTISIINNQLDDTYEQVRNLSHNLIPKKFSKNNFCDVLEEYFNNIGGTTSLSTSFVAYPRTEIDLLDETLQIEIFKIIQELITNTIKHAKATSVELQLNLVENMINVLFEDNGIGFNAKNKATGLGFENIKNRLKKVSGTFHIDSRINRGTIIDIEVPALTSINDKVSYNH
ncbi:tetratricopeptide repeat-containing sensor histidine kinase [Aquimarina megaterium]|uniref:tetratricopeptide repeat-containing sensor histidine kinase n=1 Tax=Aquimarina megaterium TaxID=1443666 RepID=UPI000944AC40|nr:tetratricopeptide repeat-containing sensor histidine kinase [Aquimarina megaterium]